MIPIIINNRNLLTWPKQMVEDLKKLKLVGDIFIIDNDSTYEPLLDWYETKPCEVLKLNNFGHAAPWICGLVEKMGDVYIVTDPDLGIQELPYNTLEVINEKLNQLPYLGKIGLKLAWECVSEDSPYYKHLQNYEKQRWLSSKTENEVYVDVHIDTTFALYNTKNYFIGGGSLNNPYVARHYPWEFTPELRNQNEEFCFYLAHASNSSSYKTFLNL